MLLQQFKVIEVEPRFMYDIARAWTLFLKVGNLHVTWPFTVYGTMLLLMHIQF